MLTVALLALNLVRSKPELVPSQLNSQARGTVSIKVRRGNDVITSKAVAK